MQLIQAVKAVGSNDDQTVFFTGQPAGYEALSVFFRHFCVTFLIDNTVLPGTNAA